MPKQKYIQIESKNALLELLEEGRSFDKILVAKNFFKDNKSERILALASQKGVPIEHVSRRTLSRKVKGMGVESVIGFMLPAQDWKLKDLLEDIYSRKEEPFFIILDHVRYSLNIGAIFRSAYGGFVNGVITPLKKSAFLTDEVLKVSMGTAERIPTVEMNIFNSIKMLKDNGVKVLALETGGKPHFGVDLTGPVAIVVGAEDVGISAKVLEKCDETITIPMKEGIGSLNVNASTAVVIFEKMRQEVENNSKF